MQGSPGASSLSSLPPPASRAHTSSFLCGRVFPDPRLRPECLCSAQRSSWLLTASCCLGFFVVGCPGDSSVTLLGVAAQVGSQCPRCAQRESLPGGRPAGFLCLLPAPRSARPSCSSSSSSPPSWRVWAGPGLRADERGGRLSGSLARMTSGRLHLSGEVGREGGLQLSNPWHPAAPSGGPMSLSPQSVLQATPQQGPLLSSPGKESRGAARPPRLSALWGGISGKDSGVPSDRGVARA